VSGRFGDLEEIRRHAKPVDAWTVRVAYPLSLRLVSLVRGTRVTPDQLTLASLAAGLLGAAWLAAAPGALAGLGWSGWLGAALCLHSSYVLDCADGQLARLRGQFSRHGWRLDLYGDRMVETAIVGAAAFAASRELGAGAWALGLAALAAHDLLKYARVHELLHASDFSAGSRSVSPGELARARRRLARLRRGEARMRRAGLRLLHVGEFYALCVVGVGLGRPDLFLAGVLAYALFALGFTVARAAASAVLAAGGVERLASEGRRPVLFGAGIAGRQAAAGLLRRDLPPVYVCDNDADKWGRRFMGCEVAPPDTLVRDRDGVVVFVASEWAPEIAEQLRGYGVDPADVVPL